MQSFVEPPAPLMRTFVLALLLSLLGLPSHAQTLWSRPYEPNQLTVEAIVPDAATEGTALSGATFVTATVSLSDNVELAAELPVARFRPSGGGARASTALGNPFVGLGLSSTAVPFLFQLGARVPVAPSNRAAPIGAAADVGHTPAFGPDEFTLSGLINTRFELSRYSTVRLRTGPEFGTRPSPTGPDRLRRWGLHYDAQIWREGERFITGLTFTGQSELSRAASRHHAMLSLMGNWSLVQPGLLAGASLNDLFREGTFVPIVGLTLSVSYGRL